MSRNNKITANRLLAFVANEARELCVPGVVNPEKRYPLVKELSEIALKQYKYRRADFNLGQEGGRNYEALEHYMMMLDAMYAPKQGEQ